MTFRELAWMVEGRRRDAWAIAAAIIANTINAHAGKVVCQPDQVNPYASGAAAAEPVETTEDITVLDALFFGDD